VIVWRQKGSSRVVALPLLSHLGSRYKSVSTARVAQTVGEEHTIKFIEVNP